jgi:septal ring-binding cell division protein DamX
MRFEVKTGGVVAILLGLAALSGAVFVMGLTAGFDVGSQTQIDAKKGEVEYPVSPPTSPAAAATEVAHADARASAPAAASTAAPRTGPITAEANNPKPAAVEQDGETGENATSAPVPAADSSPPVARVAARTAPPRRRRYNVTIQAAMDSDSADQMIQRLEELGYHPRRVPTTINGQTWYKVEVGPYASEDEAVTAEEQMRRQYNSTYDSGNVPAESSASSQPPEE